MSELEPTFVPRGELLADIRALIAEARRQTTVAVNMGLTLLYWRIGQRIHREVLGSERAAYGEQIVVTVSRQLVADYGRGYSEKNLHRMVQFAELFPEQEIVATLATIELLPLQREAFIFPDAEGGFVDTGNYLRRVLHKLAKDLELLMTGRMGQNRNNCRNLLPDCYQKTASG